MSAAVLPEIPVEQPGALRRAWPVLAGLAAMLAGIALLFASTRVEERKHAVVERTKQLRSELAVARAANLRGETRPRETALEVPPASMQLVDVEALVRVAEHSNVRLGSLQFRSEPIPNTPYLVRTAEFRIEEEYPRMRAFLAELLGRIPHLYLDELRVDQAAQADGKVQANVRMSFVYLAGRAKP